MRARLQDSPARIDVPGGAAVLNARISETRGDIGVVLTHPYGPLGGEMNNNVVAFLAMCFQAAGLTTARFNFRGVGGSTGRGTWRGSGEQQDVLAVCRHLLEMPDGPKRLIIVGYSYGSAIASSVVDALPEIKGFVAIAYPYRLVTRAKLSNNLFHYCFYTNC